MIATALDTIYRAQRFFGYRFNSAGTMQMDSRYGILLGKRKGILMPGKSLKKILPGIRFRRGGVTS